MRHILVIGAGRSATNLINYLAEKAPDQQLEITVADLSFEAANKNIQGMAHTRGIAFDVQDADQRQSLIQAHDIVISMLPAHMHLDVAKDCLAYGKNMVTASYISPAMEALDQEVRAKNLIFMNECGLDPGIDHMSAMKVIDEIRAQGGKMLLFESFTGGLIAPESDTNLWHYKFTWNPRNVVLAGQGGAAEFIQEGTYKYIPYHRLFRRTELLDIEGHGRFEAYANRNSLKYRSIYGLEDILTLYRGTIRHVGFSKAWNMFVQLGMTDDSYRIPNSENLTYKEFVNLFLPYSPTDSVALKLRHNLKIDQDDLMIYSIPKKPLTLKMQALQWPYKKF
jgi:saccharopine dehydrogenase (NAD+, L-glutamate forming)